MQEAPANGSLAWQLLAYEMQWAGEGWDATGCNSHKPRLAKVTATGQGGAKRP